MSFTSAVEIINSYVDENKIPIIISSGRGYQLYNTNSLKVTNYSIIDDSAGHDNWPVNTMIENQINGKNLISFGREEDVIVYDTNGTISKRIKGSGANVLAIKNVGSKNYILSLAQKEYKVFDYDSGTLLFDQQNLDYSPFNLTYKLINNGKEDFLCLSGEQSLIIYKLGF